MIKRYCFFIVLFVVLGCQVNDEPGMNGTDIGRQKLRHSVTEGAVASFNTPVIFVHGIASIGGDTFYNMYEKFASYGFPENRMCIPLLPRINVGSLNSNYAWYTAVSVGAYNSSHWQANNINADTLKETIDQMAPGPDAKVDLVGHSNGTAVILKLLAKYPSYSVKIRKIVFVSGFADVSAANGFDNIVSDLHHVMPFDDLPANIEYYALSSESDANIDSTEGVYGRPSNSNPDPFDDTIRFWHMDSGDDINETNYNITGMDHQRILTCDESINQVFEWLTGAAPVIQPVPATVTIGGRIVLAGIVNGYSQQGASSGTVTLKYYDPATGLETGPAGSSSISSAGRYSIPGVSTSGYLKMTVQANGGKNVYFFANRINHNSNALDFDAPVPVTSNNANGRISVRIMCRYSYLSYSSYNERSRDLYSGKIEATGCTTKNQSSSCITRTAPSSYLSINLRNYGTTGTATGNIYNFDPYLANNYKSKSVYVTSDLQDTGVKIKVCINGADRMNNIENHIVYLYR